MPANKSGLAFVEFAEHEKGFANTQIILDPGDHTLGACAYRSN